MKANGGVFVHKVVNPPNCPELRTIERYLEMVKRVLKKTKKSIKIKFLLELGKRCFKNKLAFENRSITYEMDRNDCINFFSR